MNILTKRTFGGLISF
uniref:Uncharacterized protein n=1 Tax=Anguilla anguilla TaxID=7936 RepID=A0A0E9TX14_ANGAN